jgi:hypothetical protein
MCLARRRFGLKAERTLVREHFEPNRNAVSGQKMNLLMLVLAAFIEAAEMTHHTSLFETDRLTALWTFLTQKAVLGLMVPCGIFSTAVSFIQNSGDGIRDGKHQTTVLEYRIFTTDSLQLVNDFVHRDTAAQRQGDQPPDGLGFGGG